MDNQSEATGTSRGGERRHLLAAFVALTAASGSALAQMGGGRHGGGAARSSDGASSKPRADCPKAEPTMPRDLMAAFAGRLRDAPASLAIRPPQAKAFQDFVASATEVGQHDERWIRKTLAEGVGVVSAVDPLQAYVGAESDDADDRAQALQDLRKLHAALVAQLDDAQRAALSALFTATRSDLRADLRA